MYDRAVVPQQFCIYLCSFFAVCLAASQAFAQSGTITPRDNPVTGVAAVFDVALEADVTGFNDEGDLSIEAGGSVSFTGISLSPVSETEFEVVIDGISGEGTLTVAISDFSDAVWTASGVSLAGAVGAASVDIVPAAEGEGTEEGSAEEGEEGEDEGEPAEGELEGDDLEFFCQVPLSGSLVVPPTGSVATGIAAFFRTSSNMYLLSIEHDVLLPTAAIMRKGGPGVNSIGIVRNLGPATSPISVTFTAEEFAAIYQGHHITVHSALNLAGEIRGDLGCEQIQQPEGEEGEAETLEGEAEDFEEHFVCSVQLDGAQMAPPTPSAALGIAAFLRTAEDMYALVIEHNVSSPTTATLRRGNPRLNNPVELRDLGNAESPIVAEMTAEEFSTITNIPHYVVVRSTHHPNGEIRANLTCVPTLFTHDADLNHDGRISLTELLRGVQFFNLHDYHCNEETHDGFGVGPGPTDCDPHSLDFRPTTWRIQLPELLRLIQFFNLGGYYACPWAPTVDGFCTAGS